ncbi:hypothetical protein KZ810_07150 [Sphingomonas sp. RHCKR47]|uniref:NACHT domain-containing protein n=1 Tax=Sphingomonas citricola TaxID=2862498 RepID=UPI001CA5E804|nr:hypothetical protein [Sphingomonas citricola]MBW6523274.1 hypothetical protein [Sphingomonas citricola]
MTYDFSQFSTQSFERFIQAMAAAVCGGATQIFGAGADGAREATFEGACHIGEEAWHGYTVFQAKYRTFADDPASNADWLITQIDAELAKFESARRALRRPDYYVLASNVRLSAGAADAAGKREGGVDRVSRHLNQKAAALGIKQAIVWHYDVLVALLDVHAGVRQSYSAWVRAGDVLTQLLDAGSGPELGETLLAHASERLRQAREIKTRDVGQAIGRVVNLEEVFVDLPVIQRAAQRTSVFASTHSWDQDEVDLTDIDEGDEYFAPFSPRTAVAELMRVAADRLLPATDNGEERRRPDRGRAVPGRIVLLGGPGQGKSTIGQFLAQICRARFLAARDESYAPETIELIEAILACARLENIVERGPIRYPFHVELPRYADRLNAGSAPGNLLSILAYMAEGVSQDAEEAVNVKLLGRWLATLPSVVILDGLDEVPPSGNRADVIRAIERLMDELHRLGADCLVFVTSRPQGYRNELSEKHWSHWRLEALEPEHALHLARRVAPVLVSEVSRRAEVLAVLGNAAREPTTAPLMTSPLQVMLLFQLAQTHNNIPEDRWTLFLRHYETLREREIAKGGATGEIIRELRQQIDKAHADAGYLLHVRAEQAGSADPHLTLAEFHRLVRDILDRDGFEGDLDEMAQNVVDIATERLVFLRSQTEGQVAFDVRSLQEFMAAMRLTASPEARIIERLTPIVGRSHWLHVIRIIASKIFGSPHHEALRNPLIALIDSLDRGDRDEDDRLLLTGTRLAAQLRADGVSTSVPLHDRKIASRALNLLETYDAEGPRLLADLFGFQHRGLLEPRLRERLTAADRAEHARARRLLLLLAGRATGGEADWAQDLLLEFWPCEPESAISTIDADDLLPRDGLLVERFRAAQFALHPEVVRRWIDSLSDEDEEQPALGEVAVTALVGEPAAMPLIGDDDHLTDFVFTFLPLSAAPAVDPVPADALPIWQVAAAAGQFSEAPSVKLAAAFLDVVIECDQHEEAKKLALPWLLYALLRPEGGTSLSAVREQLKHGAYGTADTWRSREEGWTQGLSVSDLVAAHQVSAGACGVQLVLPRFVGRRLSRGRDHASAREVLRSAAIQLPDSAPVAIGLMFHADRHDDPVPEESVTWLERHDDPTRYSLASRLIAARTMARLLASGSSPAWAKAGLMSFSEPVPRLMLSAKSFDRFIKAAEADKTLRQFLPLIAASGRLRLRANLRSGGESEIKASVASLTVQPTDDASVSGAITLLHLFARSNVDATDAIDRLFQWPAAPINTVLMELERAPAQDDNLVAEIARRVFVAGRWRMAPRAYRSLLQVAEAVPSGLDSDELADRLELPHVLTSM